MVPTARHQYGEASRYKDYVDSPPYPKDTTLGFWINRSSAQIDSIASACGGIEQYDDYATANSTLKMDIEMICYEFVRVLHKQWKLSNDRETAHPSTFEDFNPSKEWAALIEQVRDVISAVEGGGIPAIIAPVDEEESRV